MRIMPFSFPDDPAVADMFDEYMLGDALLVAPVLTAGATSRAVYLPPVCGSTTTTRRRGIPGRPRSPQPPRSMRFRAS